MALTLLGVSVLVFGMIRLVPGTVVEQLLGQAAIASPEVLQSFRRFFGLDRPLHVQYLDWLGGVVRGDLGASWLSGRPVLGLFLERVPVSAELALLAVGWSLCLGIPLGVVSATRPGGARDGAIRVLATLGLSLPAFWQGTVLILLFSVYLGWMPSLQWVPLLTRPGGEPPDHGAAGLDPRHGDGRDDHPDVPLVDAGRARARVRADGAGARGSRRRASPTTTRCGTR